MNLEEFKRRVLALDGRLLTTGQGKGKSRFLVQVTDQGLLYTPESSGISRPHSWTSIARVLDRFSVDESLRPVTYHDMTRHSSYIVTVLHQLIHPSGPPPMRTSNVPMPAPEPEQTRDKLESLAGADVPVREGLSGTEPADIPSRPHQRVGAVSNAHVGADFERVALEFFAGQGIRLTRGFGVEVGIRSRKVHQFDLGSAEEKIIVECKSHRWTAGASVPSAKMTVWNEAMFYFLLAPADYRKILFVLHDRREKGGESLLDYYTRTYSHLIPDNVEFMEWDEATGEIVRI